MPYKELQFFNKQYDKGIDWYFRHFDDTPPDCFAGEFTPDYLSSREAVSRLHQHVPEAKLIVILREPLERAFSAFQLHRSHGDYQGLSIREAVALNPALIKNGLYFEQLIYLFEFFPREQVEIFLHDEVTSNGPDVYRRACNYLGIDDLFIPASLGSVRNTSAYAAIQGRFGVNSLIKLYRRPGLKKLRDLLSASGLQEHVRSYLIIAQESSSSNTGLDDEIVQTVLDDTMRLESLLGRSLEDWRAKQHRVLAKNLRRRDE